jgi:hypothetical protein
MLSHIQLAIEGSADVKFIAQIAVFIEVISEEYIYFYSFYSEIQRFVLKMHFLLLVSARKNHHQAMSGN